ncbi:MAG TPA: hypothetical protein VNN07_01730 [Candidatus Tectomicrobia bacterium]|jgi:hypothetical protein|nr:hypothetical protein [Candidatus Tectomicrobia bacterium]
MTTSSPTRVHNVRDFRAPVDDTRAGRLVFDAGAPQLRLSGDQGLPDLLRARFSRILPDVRTSGGEIVVIYPPVVPVLGWIRQGVLQPQGEVTLNATFPWELEFRGGITRLEADLRDVDVRDVVIRSGVSYARLRLGMPSGTVRVAMAGGVGDLDVERPADVPIRLTVDGAIGSLDLEDDSLGAIGGRLRRTSDGWAEAADRFDVAVLGGIGHLAVAASMAKTLRRST